MTYKAHESGIEYIMKENNDEIISCGEDGFIKRWLIDFKNFRYKLIEVFLINNSPKVHK